MKAVAKAEKERQPLVNSSDLLLWKLTEHAPDPSLINRS
jgi:hypothetical protein